MSTYKISELQRHLIERALKEGKPHMDIRGDGEAYKTALEEFDALTEMFSEPRPATTTGDGSEFARVVQEQRRREVVEAAMQGVREYLRSTRGAALCGANAHILEFDDRLRFEMECSTRDNITYHFDIMEI